MPFARSAGQARQGDRPKAYRPYDEGGQRGIAPPAALAQGPVSAALPREKAAVRPSIQGRVGAHPNQSPRNAGRPARPAGFWGLVPRRQGPCAYSRYAPRAFPCGCIAAGSQQMAPLFPFRPLVFDGRGFRLSGTRLLGNAHRYPHTHSLCSVAEMGTWLRC